MSEEIDWVPMMEGVARELWGDPNPRMGKPRVEIRWGDSGRRSVDLVKGTWFDNGTKEGGGVLQLIKRDLGLEGKDAFAWLEDKGFLAKREESQPQQKKSGGLGELVATWPYTDEQGKTLYEVRRYEDGTINEKTGKRNKTFRQCRTDPGHPDAKNGIVWHIRDVRRVLSDLPAIIEAVAAGRPIVVVEGEKAKDAARSIGLDATTNAMGAGKWEESFSLVLAGAHVIIVPDDDDEGRNHASIVAADVRKHAKSVRVLALPTKKPKDDMYEWVAQGGTREAFLELARQTPVWRPAPPISRFGAVEWREMDAPGQEFEYRIHGLLAKYGVAVIGGPSGSGKSFLATDIGFAIARGVEYAGRRTERGLVLFQAGEGGLGIKKRMRAYRKAHEIAEELPFVLLPGDLDLHGSDDPTNAFITEGKAWAAYYGMPVGTVFIDTLASATPGANENDSGDMSKVLGRCSRIAKELNCLVVLIHHMNAAGDKLRGHTSIRANVDNVLLVQKMEIVDREKRPKRKVELAKDKEGEDGVTWHFVLKQIVVGQDAYGNNITSCIVAPPQEGDAEQQQMERVRLTDDDQVVYRALKAVIAREGLPVPGAVRAPKSVTAVASWDAFCEEVRRKWLYVDDMTLSDEENQERRAAAARDGLKRCVGRLQTRGIIDRDMDLRVIWDLDIPRYARVNERGERRSAEQAIEEAIDDRNIAETVRNELGFA